MKMLVAIVQDDDSTRLLGELVRAGFGATYVGSTGGFLRTGTAAILIGVDDDRAQAAASLVRRVASGRVEQAPVVPHDLDAEAAPGGDDPIVAGGAHVFVVPVARFERI